MGSFLFGAVAGFFLGKYWPKIWAWLVSKGVSFP